MISSVCSITGSSNAECCRYIWMIHSPLWLCGCRELHTLPCYSTTAHLTHKTFSPVICFYGKQVHAQAALSHKSLDSFCYTAGKGCYILYKTGGRVLVLFRRPQALRQIHQTMIHGQCNTVVFLMKQTVATVTWLVFICHPTDSRRHASVLWRCWLGGSKGSWPVKNWVVGCWYG